jgi:hypothetical protein
MATILTEDWLYPDGPNTGNNGGTGWTSAWLGAAGGYISTNKLQPTSIPTYRRFNTVDGLKFSFTYQTFNPSDSLTFGATTNPLTTLLAFNSNGGGTVQAYVNGTFTLITSMANGVHTCSIEYNKLTGAWSLTWDGITATGTTTTGIVFDTFYVQNGGMFGLMAPVLGEDTLPPVVINTSDSLFSFGGL